MLNIKPLNMEKHFHSIIKIIEDIRHTKLDETAKVEIKESLKKLVTKADSSMLVHEIDGQAVAYINYHFVEFPLIQGKEMYITELFILENHRGQGIGTALLNKAFAHAKGIGAKRVCLLNSQEKLSYQREFYKKYGFTERPTMNNFVMSIEQ